MDFHKRHTYILFVFSLVTITGIGIIYYQTRPYHFRAVEQGRLYRSGYLEPQELQKIIRKHNIRTVVNLCLPREEVYQRLAPEEATVCQQNGAEIVYIPLKGNTPPDEQQRKIWLDLIHNPEAAPILVHCAQGVMRTGIMVAIYDMEKNARSGKEAFALLPTFGHDMMSDRRQMMRDYIFSYQPAYTK